MTKDKLVLVGIVGIVNGLTKVICQFVENLLKTLHKDVTHQSVAGEKMQDDFTVWQLSCCKD